MADARTGATPRADPTSLQATRANGQAQNITDADVADRPRLAPNVELSGEMHEGGFADKQWLLQRDGRFVQVTELIYRVAEQATGDHTLDEMAHGVSDATGRRVSADNVRYLLVNKLIPMGLVEKADGTVAEVAGAGAPRSALQVRMKLRMIGPEYIEPITVFLQVLFKPYLLIPVLLICVAAQAWVFFVHGVAAGVHQAMYSPALMLVTLGLIIASTAFHEFGHAAALRYGGGKVRGMGAGLYIVYPAFYTDVTDNYRLPRWSRVRTDLGGFYFNWIFNVVLVGLYLLTRQEILLLPVLLINLEIIHQCLPFVRLDGYWALADATGIPDLFTHIGPFLRTVLPFTSWKGRTLPPMKRWVRVVFGTYVLVTIPVLTFMLFMMIKSVPRILATAWDSAGQQTNAFSLARDSGDAAGMAAAVIQTAILALPTLGLCYSVFGMGRRATRGLYNWSKPTPMRRLAGSTIGLGAVALLAYLWIPQLPLGGPGTAAADARAHWTPIRADERGTIQDVVKDLPIARALVPATVPSWLRMPDVAHPSGTGKLGSRPGNLAAPRVALPSATATPTPPATSTAVATAASISLATPASAPSPTPTTTGVATKAATATRTPLPTASATAQPTWTPIPPTRTPMPQPTATTPPTETPPPTFTSTIAPTRTATARPSATVAAIAQLPSPPPSATPSPLPTDTATPEPPTRTPTPRPTATDTSTPRPSATPVADRHSATDAHSYPNPDADRDADRHSLPLCYPFHNPFAVADANVDASANRVPDPRSDEHGVADRNREPGGDPNSDLDRNTASDRHPNARAHGDRDLDTRSVGDTVTRTHQQRDAGLLVADVRDARCRRDERVRHPEWHSTDAGTAGRGAYGPPGLPHAGSRGHAAGGAIAIVFTSQCWDPGRDNRRRHHRHRG